MLRRSLLPAFACLAIALTPAASASATSSTPVTETASAGNVQAQLDYVRIADDSGFTHYEGLKITIHRGGRLVPQTNPHPGAIDGLWPGYAWKQGAKSIDVQDLDKDGEPEVTVDINSGGVHCCAELWAYRFTGSSYVSAAMATGSSPYTQRDLNRDGKPEWVTADPRFEYLFTSFAGSGVPLRVYTYTAARFALVTRSYPALVRADAARWWRIYLRSRKQPSGARDVRGFLAAWAADEYLLGKGAKVWPALQASLRRGELTGDRTLGPTGAAYIAKLRRELRKLGYS